MDIFLSWSGDRRQLVLRRLRDNFFPPVRWYDPLTTARLSLAHNTQRSLHHSGWFPVSERGNDMNIPFEDSLLPTTRFPNIGCCT
jgi:hypothetical protein